MLIKTSSNKRTPTIARSWQQLGLILATLILLGACAGTSERLSPRAERSLDEFFSDLQAQRPGAAVLISRDGKPIYERYLGLAQLDNGLPIQADTVFHVGSVAKQFTAYALMQLAIDGKVDLNSPVQRYLGDFPSFEQPITVAQLLYHSSGLRDQLDLLAMAGWRSDQPVDAELLREVLYAQRGLNHSPGEEFSYTNSGYWLIAEIIEKLTGSTLPQWAQQHIFTPLGMTHSRFLTAHDETVAGLAQTYQQNDGWQPGQLNILLPGAAGLVSNARDLARWQTYLLSLREDNPPLWAALNRPGRLLGGDVPEDMRGEYYAAGLFVGEHAGLATLGHSGRISDYEAATYLFPDHDLSVVVLLNAAWQPPRNIALLLGEAVLREQGRWLPPPSAPIRFGGELDQALIELAQGIYTAPQPLKGANLPPRIGLALIQREGGLEVSVLGRPPERARPIDANRFRTDAWSRMEIRLNQNSAGEAQVSVDFGDGPVRLQPAHCGDNKPGSELDGLYHNAELNTVYQLRNIEGRLLAAHTRLDPVGLLCLSEDLFLTVGAEPGARGFATAEVVRDSAGNVTGLYLSNGERLRNVFFRKLFNADPGA